MTTHNENSHSPRGGIHRVRPLLPTDADYPAGASQWRALCEWGGLFDETPQGESLENVRAPQLSAWGDLTLLNRPTLALICSVKCPGDLILATFEFARAACAEGPSIVGGFQSPMERTCLDTLLARHVPAVICPGHALNPRGIHAAWKRHIEENRLLLVSPFAPKQRRVTSDLARQRNLFVAAIADTLFVPYAAPGGKTLALVRAALGRGKKVLTLPHADNQELISLGAEEATVETLAHR